MSSNSKNTLICVRLQTKREDRLWRRKKEPKEKLEVFRIKKGDFNNDIEKNKNVAKVSKMLGDS